MPIDPQILQRLQANDRTLTTLDLSGQKLFASDMQELVKTLQGNTSLKSLDVSKNQIGAEGAKALAQNQTLTSLNVSENQIGDEGAKALAQNQTLTSLNVGWNQIEDEGAKALAQNQTLTSLTVMLNWIGPEGAKALAQNKILTSLDVSNNQIRDEGAEALAQNQILTSLDVSGNKIGAEALHHLKQILAANKKRKQERRNQFILALSKILSLASALASTTFALPPELIHYIGSYLDAGFFLQLAKIEHPRHMDKTEQQIYQAMLFLLHHLAAGDWVEASIREHKPQMGQALDYRRHFTLFNSVRNLQAANAAILPTEIEEIDESQPGAVVQTRKRALEKPEGQTQEQQRQQEVEEGASAAKKQKLG